LVDNPSRICISYPAIDDIHRQPIKELEAIKKALDMTFEYLDHPLAYKWVKDKVVVVLTSRQAYLKKT
jgi:hypothetical protein